MAQKWTKIAILGPKMLQMTHNLDILCICVFLWDEDAVVRGCVYLCCDRIFIVESWKFSCISC